MTTPRTFSHIGLSVPDLDAAVQFYSDVLGLYLNATNRGHRR